MITALVQFQLQTPISLAEATKRFESTAPKYKSVPGLIRKYYVRAEDGRVAGGIYLWQTRDAAERMYSPEWRAMVEKVYGVTPTITWFDTPVIVDNLADGAVTKAA